MQLLSSGGCFQQRVL